MTSRTKSERLRRLVSHGYFAPELPPCFVSEGLAKYRNAILAGISALPSERNVPAYQRFVSEPTWFYFPRFGKEDRRHGVPNPIAHLLLSRVIAENYIDLRRKSRTSGLSLSPPVFDWQGGRALMRPSVDLRDRFRIDLSSRREEYVVADIRAFFHSIYTHAIPWAIYGKAWAKQNRAFTHYGNLIDLLCRNAQDGQTIGLPVGPDTSRLISEVIASAIDGKLKESLKIGGRDASRYIDDYTVSSESDVAAEKLLANLRQSVAFFELELSNEKSAIFSTSHRQTTGWQQAVQALIPRDDVDDDAMQRFFYELGRICPTLPEINVEKFALQNARSAFVRAENWSNIQSILINAYRRNPSLISFLVEICLLRQIAREDVRLNDLHEFIENRIPVLANANRTGEVVWLLFLAARLKLKISAKSLSPLFYIENALAALLVSFLDAHGLVHGSVDRTVWNASLNETGLRGTMWLYAYEATVQGFVPGETGAFIAQDKYFSLLHDKQVRFLAIEQGFTTLGQRLKSLRGENERMRRLRKAIQDESGEELDEFDDTEISFDSDYFY